MRPSPRNSALACPVRSSDVQTIVVTCCYVAVTVACATSPRATSSHATTGESTAPLIDPVTYASKISALKATLARSHIAIDDPETGPRTLSTCAGRDTKGCVTCVLATRDDTAGIDPETLDGISIAFAAYSSGALAQSTLEHVALCKTIRLTRPDTGDEEPPAGVAVIGDHRMLVSVEQQHGIEHAYASFSIEEVVHHEMFHFFDRNRVAAEVPDGDPEWLALNAPAFAYRDPADLQARPGGFVTAYATTSPAEDRAATYEWMLGHPVDLCRLVVGDPVIAAKAKIVWKRIVPIVGVELLRSHVRCVDPTPDPKRPKSGPIVPADRRKRPINLKLPTNLR